MGKLASVGAGRGGEGERPWPPKWAQPALGRSGLAQYSPLAHMPWPNWP
ncbi:MAG: hypothetical protein IPL28_21735 [Chloroflexi bacterium]|nr:hypothetical protein [Chloroflexota bacterium]